MKKSKLLTILAATLLLGFSNLVLALPQDKSNEYSTLNLATSDDCTTTDECRNRFGLIQSCVKAANGRDAISTRVKVCISRKCVNANPVFNICSAGEKCINIRKDFLCERPPPDPYACTTNAECRYRFGGTATCAGREDGLDVLASHYKICKDGRCEDYTNPRWRTCPRGTICVDGEKDEEDKWILTPAQCQDPLPTPIYAVITHENDITGSVPSKASSATPSSTAITYGMLLLAALIVGAYSVSKK